VVVYNLQKPLPPNLNINQVCQHAHQNNGFVMVLGLTKRHAQNLNNIKGQPIAPDAVEIFNAANSAGFQNMVIEYPAFITSGAKNATEL
ncbi:hypothetical protein ACKI1Z_42020, partial [Streptomyces galilaeus]|uniref:hypothetical protein n=1 Tax=Streptomyces galilaeus TaxID=33899 RepID=UPI0038F60DAC